MVDDKKVSQILRQVRQASEEKFPEGKTGDSESNDALTKNLLDNSEKKISLGSEQEKVQDESWAKKRIAELEAEIKELVYKRQQEMRTRYEQKKKEEEKKEASVPVVASKPKRGFWGRRIKSAQQQAQPETVGRRVSG